MKTLPIKELLGKYKKELKFIDFDDDLELVIMLAIRNQLIDRFEALTEEEVKTFLKLEDGFIEYIENLKGFDKEIMFQNSKLYIKLKKAA
jgi:hypothetical protein